MKQSILKATRATRVSWAHTFPVLPSLPLDGWGGMPGLKYMCLEVEECDYMICSVQLNIFLDVVTCNFVYICR